MKIAVVSLGTAVLLILNAICDDSLSENITKSSRKVSEDMCPSQKDCHCSREALGTCLKAKCTSQFNEPVHSNNFTHLPKSVCQLSLIDYTEVIFSSEFLSDFTELSKIKYENIATLVKIEDLLQTLTPSARLNMTDCEFPRNNISKLPDVGFENFTNLIMLDLSSNRISYLQAPNFLHLHNVTTLILSDNRLEILENDTFVNLPKLEHLYLESNCLTSIDSAAFDGLTSLRELYLGFNNLTIIHPGTMAIPNLLTLDLKHNRFQVISGSMTESPNLHTLYVHDNNATVIEASAARRRPQIRYFYVDNNHLSVLPKEFYEDYDYDVYGETISQLYNNPLKCDCLQLPFVIWLHQRRLRLFGNESQTIMLSSESNLICHDPPLLFNRSLVDLTFEELTCDDSTVAPINCSDRSKPQVKCEKLRDKTCNQSQASNSCLCNATTAYCHFCPEGFYGLAENDVSPPLCRPCPPLTTSPFGSNDLSQCQCVPGFTRIEKDGAHNRCHECPYNTFKYHVGPEACIECDPNTANGTEYVASSHCKCLSNRSVDIVNGTCPLPPPISGTNGTTHFPSFTKGDRSTDQYKSSYETILFVMAATGSLACLGIVSGLVHRYAFKQKKKPIKKDMQLTMNQLLQTISFPQSYENSYINIENVNSFMVELHQIRFEGILGQGAFGQVHKAVVNHLQNGPGPTTVAIKSLRDNHTDEEKDALNSELQQLLYVGHHPNIVNLLGFVCVDDRLMLIIEYAALGDLLSYLKNKVMDTQYASLQFDSSASTSRLTINQSSATAPRTNDNVNRIDAKTLLVIVWQVAKGMHHLAQMKCIHRDLAARNVLLTEDLVAKVSDFGLARAVYESGYYFKETKGRLPFKWMPPEAILEGQYTTKSDVWSFGILLWEVTTLGGSPYPGVPINGLLDLLLSGYRMAKPSNCSESVYEVMKSCWRERPQDRPGFEKLCDHLDQILQQTANSEYMDVCLMDDMEINIPEEIHENKTANESILLAERVRLLDME